MSTLWYDTHCAECHSVEDNTAWHQFIRNRVKRAVVHLEHGASYIDKINQFPDGYFDLIVIDGTDRYDCFCAALRKCKRGTIVLVDDTDTPALAATAGRIAGSDLFDVYRFTGFAPTSFFAKETSVLVWK